MPRRVLNWDVKLATFASETYGRAFQWGETDCGTLVRKAHAVMYGEDLYRFLGDWDSPAAAGRILASRGGFSGILAELDAQLVDLAYVQSGDVLCAMGHGGAIGLAAVAVAGKVLIADEASGITVEEMPVAGVDAIYRLPWEVRAWAA